MAPPPATKASMSACLILPAGPLPFNDERSIPEKMNLQKDYPNARIGLIVAKKMAEKSVLSLIHI